jgi:hypothetical protein
VTGKGVRGILDPGGPFKERLQRITDLGDDRDGQSRGHGLSRKHGRKKNRLSRPGAESGEQESAARAFPGFMRTGDRRHPMTADQLSDKKSAGVAKKYYSQKKIEIGSPIFKPNRQEKVQGEADINGAEDRQSDRFGHPDSGFERPSGDQKIETDARHAEKQGDLQA